MTKAWFTQSVVSRGHAWVLAEGVELQAVHRAFKFHEGERVIPEE